MTKAKEAAIDPRSDAVVLAYVGLGTVAHVPARDLHGGDLNRIAYERAHQATDWENPEVEMPREIATSGQLTKLADELVESGAYSRDVPHETNEPDQPATTDEPAAPAEG